MILEPKWKSWIVETTTPIFTPEQCKMIIDAGRRQPPQKAQVGMGKPGAGTDTNKRVTTISWLPFDEMKEMYNDINNFIQKANLNHFGFGDVQITEQAQFTEYPEGGFYDWHMDCDVAMAHEPPVRKISMTLLLSPENQFEGGDFQIQTGGEPYNVEVKKGDIILFPSYILHRVSPVTKGVRHSLVAWTHGRAFV